MAEENQSDNQTAENQSAVVEVREKKSDAIAGMQLLNAANLDANVHELERDGKIVFEVRVPLVHADLAAACLSSSSDSQEAGEFCFHCGASVTAGTSKCPECGGDLSEDA